MERSSGRAGLQSTGSFRLGGLQVGPRLVKIRLSFSKIKDGRRSEIKTIANDLDMAELGRKLNLFFVKSQ